MIGIYGGTFDPIHIGHLRAAIDAGEQLGLDEIVLMPAAVPNLKATPGVSAEQRAAMAELAIRDLPQFRVDRRELTREGVSYTVDTLAELRAELGVEASLVFLMGTDSLVNLHRWDRWESLFDLANIAVLTRPGDHPEFADAVSERCASARVGVASLREHAHGRIAFVEQPPLDVASTDIRARLRGGKNVRFLLPEPVIEYIAQHNLYRNA